VRDDVKGIRNCDNKPSWLWLGGYEETVRRWGGGSSVSVVTSIWAGWSGVWFLVGARDLSALQSIQFGYGDHPASYSIHTAALLYR
jgi:hypothetical protein